MWRYSSEPVHLFILDCRSLIPIVIWLGHMREWTFILAVISILIFGCMAWFGLTLPVAYRMARVLFAGSRRPRLPAWKKRRFA
ncbi:MAG: IcmT/TraK family protein [Acetobacter sp.]|uniref:IcmT/TraK family protein n=1 Tax=Acetobacter sp. TaxID=440 RepID=UPI0039EC8C77